MKTKLTLAAAFVAAALSLTLGAAPAAATGGSYGGGGYCEEQRCKDDAPALSVVSCFDNNINGRCDSDEDDGVPFVVYNESWGLVAIGVNNVHLRNLAEGHYFVCGLQNLQGTNALWQFDTLDDGVNNMSSQNFGSETAKCEAVKILSPGYWYKKWGNWYYARRCQFERVKLPARKFTE